MFLHISPVLCGNTAQFRARCPAKNQGGCAGPGTGGRRPAAGRHAPDTKPVGFDRLLATIREMPTLDRGVAAAYLVNIFGLGVSASGGLGENANVAHTVYPDARFCVSRSQ